VTPLSWICLICNLFRAFHLTCLILYSSSWSRNTSTTGFSLGKLSDCVYQT
jgi:hypothetical protein